MLNPITFGWDQRSPRSNNSGTTRSASTIQVWSGDKTGPKTGTAPGRPDHDQGKGEHGSGHLGRIFHKFTVTCHQKAWERRVTFLPFEKVKRYLARARSELILDVRRHRMRVVSVSTFAHVQSNWWPGPTHLVSCLENESQLWLFRWVSNLCPAYLSASSISQRNSLAVDSCWSFQSLWGTKGLPIN